jgi:hypothetical protein
MLRRGTIRYLGSAIVIVLNATMPLANAAGDLVPFEGLKEQFTIALPGGWNVYNQSESLSGERGPFGVVFFSAQPLTKPGEKTADVELLAKADVGEIPSFFVDRQPAGKDMACSDFSRIAGGRVARMARNDPAFSKGRELPMQFFPERIELGGCQGFKVQLRALHSNPEKAEWIIDVRAVSDGTVLYLFSLRARIEHYKQILGTFERVLATLKLSSAR